MLHLQTPLKALLQPWAWAMRMVVYWLLFFLFFRLWFILWLRQAAHDALPWEAFWYALPLDFSAAGYLTAPAVLLAYAAGVFGQKGHRYAERLFEMVYLVLLLLAIAVYGANIFLYEEWYTPINSRAYEHFRIPGAMLSSMSAAFKLGSLVLFLLLGWVWWRLCRSVVGRLPSFTLQKWEQGLNAVLLSGGIVLLMRGGLGRLPVNESSVCYSSETFRNDVATNAGWYFVHSLIETSKAINRYKTYEPEIALQLTKELLPSPPAGKEMPHGWLRRSDTLPPNLVIILLESMTAQVIAELGGMPGVCPNFSRMAQQGILFEHAYGSGYRTDQGVVSVLSGYPALPDHSVVFVPEKAQKLPSLPRALKSAGYSTAFVYGGELTFANMGSWLRHQQVEHIVSVRDFEAKDITQLWGADDQRLFRKSVQLLRTLPQPFFAGLMTLSLHAPFDVPLEQPWQLRSDREKFVRCAHFVDQALGEFFDKVASEPWYANTLFVLVADHGHPLPGRIPMNHWRSRHIPLLLYGPVLAPSWRGKCIGTPATHHDIPATLLRELGIDRRAFRWSRDLFDAQAPAFAYYSNESGLGWLTPLSTGFFDFKTKRWSGSLTPLERAQAEAYLQTLYDDFLAL